MIYTCYIDVTQFENETLFREKLNLLSPCRQRKIAQLKQEKDRHRSLGAGLALDHALGIYGNGLRERDMEYVFGEWGKPSLRNYPEIHFSLSHSGAYAMCSIGGSPVGNDIEWIRPGRLKVAERFFTAQELAFLYRGQDKGRQSIRTDSSVRQPQSDHDEDDGELWYEAEETTQRLFRIWTMKESFLKVTGRGMSLPLNDFSVVVEEEKQAVCVKQCFDDVTYQMKEYGDIAGYRAAVCCPAGEEIEEGMQPVMV